MAREDLHFRLRIPEYLKEQVEKAAAESGQSMTAEIVRRLHLSFDEDHMTVPLPRALQERIKRYADGHHRAPEAEIARILEREFPAPLSIESRVEDMMGLVDVLRGEGTSDEVVDKLNDQLYELLKGIAVGRVKGVSDDYRRHVRDKLSYWEREQMQDQESIYMQNMDPEELESMWIRGDPFKNDSDE